VADARSRKVAAGLAIAGFAVPGAIFLVDWLVWDDVWAGALGVLFLGIPLGLALLVAAAVVGLSGRRD
jgi:hypothetical protein